MVEQKKKTEEMSSEVIEKLETAKWLREQYRKTLKQLLK